MRLRLFLFRLARLNTFKKKFRASLAVGGIALSSAVMVGLFGIGAGLQSLIVNQVAAADARDVITVNQRNTQIIKLDQERVSSIRSISGVGQVEQSVGLVGLLNYHGFQLSVPVYAVSEGYFDISRVERVSGEVDQQPQGNSIVLSSKSAEILGLSARSAAKRQLSLGLSVPKDFSSRQTETSRDIKPAPFTVAGVIDKGNLPVVYMPLEYMRTQGVDSVNQLKIKLTYPDKMASVRESIEQMGLQTTSIQDSIDQVNRIFSVIQRILLLFGLISLVITVFGTFTVITLTLIEETRQVGFLRIMGLQKHEVGFLFIAQAIMLTTFGAVLGIVAGVIFGLFANGATRALVGDTVFANQVYIFKIPVFQIIIMLMLSVGLGWLIGSIPAKRAILIGPLEELKE